VTLQSPAPITSNASIVLVVAASDAMTAANMTVGPRASALPPLSLLFHPPTTMTTANSFLPVGPQALTHGHPFKRYRLVQAVVHVVPTAHPANASVVPVTLASVPGEPITRTGILLLGPLKDGNWTFQLSVVCFASNCVGLRVGLGAPLGLGSGARQALLGWVEPLRSAADHRVQAHNPTPIHEFVKRACCDSMRP
jgi:hypothetical protein